MLDDETTGLTRADLLRRAMAAGVTLTSVPLLAACGSSASAGPVGGPAKIARGSTVKLYNWEGYDNKTNLKQFKRQFDVTVRPTYIAGDQEVFTKLGAQKGQ